jgi:hypothetical protein
MLFVNQLKREGLKGVGIDCSAKVQISLRPVQRLIQVGIALRAVLEASKVGAWLCRALVCIGGQGGALPLPASGARERQLGQHVVLSLPDTVQPYLIATRNPGGSSHPSQNRQIMTMAAVSSWQ